MTACLLGFSFTSAFLPGTWADRVGTGGRKAPAAPGGSPCGAAGDRGLGPDARGAATLVAARAVVGVGEATATAAIAPAIIDDLASPARKGRFMAIFNSAIPIGSALGYIVGGGGRARLRLPPRLLRGRRARARLGPPVPSHRRAGAARGRDPAPFRVGASVAASWRIPVYRSTVLGYCAYTFAIGGFAFWAPKYLHTRYGFEAGLASQYFGMVTVVCGFVGTLAGGWLADALVRRRLRRDRSDADAAFVRASLSVCAIAAGLGAPFALIAILAGTPRGFFLAGLIPCEVALLASNEHRQPGSARRCSRVPAERATIARGICGDPSPRRRPDASFKHGRRARTQQVGASGAAVVLRDSPSCRPSSPWRRSSGGGLRPG